MQGSFERAALAAALGLGVVAGLARAQGINVIVPQPYPTLQQQVIVSGPTGGGSALGPGGITGYGYGVQAPPSTAGSPYPVLPNMIPRPPAPEDNPPYPGAIKAWMNKHNICCWSSINSLGCGSFHSDFYFMFGSCRRFFGEPCIPGPPPLPWAQQPGSASGYGYGQKGCACP